MRTGGWLVVVWVGAQAVAAPATADDGPIQDNSFLVEEAYNQEAGVVQHISTLAFDGRSSDVDSTFTEEWPLGGIRHQLSYTLELARAAGGRGPGDLLLNYRYQLVGDGDAALAVSPRISLLLPTGDARRGRGAGAVGLQVALPASFVLGERWVAHSNLGATFVPNAEAADGARADTTSWFAGQSLVLLLRPKLNLMLEAVGARAESPRAGGGRGRASSLFLSPGLRFAFDLPSGLQIVPGVAVPIGVGPSAGEGSVFLYLSFEHPF